MILQNKMQKCLRRLHGDKDKFAGITQILYSREKLVRKITGKILVQVMVQKMVFLVGTAYQMLLMLQQKSLVYGEVIVYNCSSI